MTACRRVTGCAASHVGGRNERFACTQCLSFKIMGKRKKHGELLSAN